MCRRGHDLQFSGHQGHRISNKSAGTTSLETRLKKDHVDMRWATEQHILSDNSEAIANSIHYGKAIAVTDGSFKAKMGTAAFILEEKNSQHCLVAANQAPGYPEDQSFL